jgi:uncharacterized protein (DUF2336 family)
MIMMNSTVLSLQDELPNLLSLAATKTPQARRTLAERLASLFLSQDSDLAEREQNMVQELIEELIGSMDPAFRQDMAMRLSKAPFLPKRLVMNLISDSAEVALPLLQSYKRFSDDELVSIIDTHGTDHAAAIALRREISEVVADALIVTGDIEIMSLVAENLGARLSPTAMKYLCDSARFHEILQAPIVKRPELSPDTARKIYWWLVPTYRQNVLKRFGFVQDHLDRTFEKVLEEFLQGYELIKDDDMAMQEAADWLMERQQITLKNLTHVLRLGYFRLFNIMLGQLSGLQSDSIEQLLNETGGGAFAAVCRALGADRALFISIFLLSRGGRSGEQIVHPRELSLAIAAFDRINQDVAEKMMEQWQRDATYLTERLGRLV